jgi:hypothetical protein
MSTYLVLIPHNIVLYVLGTMYVIETHGLTSKREPLKDNLQEKLMSLTPS